jgi:plasmid stabilization system protein ParE
MQEYEIDILPRAKFDLDEIWMTIASVDFDRADRFIAKLENKISKLSKLPEIGSPRFELLSNMRILVEGNYLIFYAFDGNKVVVMNIVHGARDLSELDFT